MNKELVNKVLKLSKEIKSLEAFEKQLSNGASHILRFIEHFNFDDKGVVLPVNSDYLKEILYNHQKSIALEINLKIEALKKELNEL